MTDHVVVAGGGVVGWAVALAVAEAGYPVTVVDPGRGGSASVGNAGLLVPSYCLPTPSPAELWQGLRLLGRRRGGVALHQPWRPSTAGFLTRLLVATPRRGAAGTAQRLHALATRSRARYDQLAAADPSLELRTTGWLWVAEAEPTWRAARRRAARLSRVGVRVEELTPDAARDREPALGGPVAGALHFPDDASVDPALLLAALQRRAVALGATTVRGTVERPVRRGGRLVGVATSAGDVRADQAVLAVGAGSHEVGRRFGLRLPVLAGCGWSVTLPFADHPLVVPLDLLDGHVVVSPQPGRVRLTTGMELGGRPDGCVPAAAVTALRAAAERALPVLREAGSGTTWRGARPMTPHGLPIVRTARRDPNLHVATGHGTLGVTLAAGTAELVLALVRQRAAGRAG